MNTQFTFRDKIGSVWARLTGDPSEFPLEYRIFHSICLIAIVALGYNVPFNFFIGLYVSGLLSLVSAVIFMCLYYRSRFMNKMHGSVIMCAIVANMLFVANFFYNSGIAGPTDLLTAASILLVIAITPHRQHKIWLSLNIITVLALHAIEYYYPQLVPDKYYGRADRFFDKTSAYLVVVLMMYYTITYVRRNYDYEKRHAEEKKAAIEDQHQYILVQNEQLEHLNSEKNKLMSIIAHDLRGPLSNIQNYLELVTEYGLDKEEREAVEGDLLKRTQVP